MWTTWLIWKAYDIPRNTYWHQTMSGVEWWKLKQRLTLIFIKRINLLHACICMHTSEIITIGSIFCICWVVDKSWWNLSQLWNEKILVWKNGFIIFCSHKYYLLLFSITLFTPCNENCVHPWEFHPLFTQWLTIITTHFLAKQHLLWMLWSWMMDAQVIINFNRVSLMHAHIKIHNH